MTQEFYDHDTPSEVDLDLCYGSKFLSATELGDKKIRTRILKVKKEPLRGQDGKEKNKFVLSFSNLDKSSRGQCHEYQDPRRRPRKSSFRLA